MSGQIVGAWSGALTTKAISHLKKALEETHGKGKQFSITSSGFSGEDFDFVFTMESAAPKREKQTSDALPDSEAKALGSLCSCIYPDWYADESVERLGRLCHACKLREGPVAKPSPRNSSMDYQGQATDAWKCGNCTRSVLLDTYYAQFRRIWIHAMNGSRTCNALEVKDKSNLTLQPKPAVIMQEGSAGTLLACHNSKCAHRVYYAKSGSNHYRWFHTGRAGRECMNAQKEKLNTTACPADMAYGMAFRDEYEPWLYGPKAKQEEA